MIYSVHNPYEGGFEYLQGPGAVPINDDMPTPRYPSAITTALGVPATLAARPLPQGSQPVGRGAVPIGSVSSGQPGEWSSTSKSIVPSGLGADGISSGTAVNYAVWALVIGVVGYMFWSVSMKRSFL